MCFACAGLVVTDEASANHVLILFWCMMLNITYLANSVMDNYFLHLERCYLSMIMILWLIEASIVFTICCQIASQEMEAYPMLGILRTKTSTLALERVRRLKKMLLNLIERVQKVTVVLYNKSYLVSLLDVLSLNSFIYLL
jgi:hypothetical protein